ncbi:MAG: nucleotidyltransferase domain-containing protein [Verrucomicrobiales bacterium]|nr:nucleotidyltransferase domain-containing protein [Verrucomicrobiales bacterium]
MRSLNSCMLKWPDKQTVDAAIRVWARQLAAQRHEVVRVGYAGSYARGDWGVGSDLDIVIVLEQSDKPFEQRAVEFDATRLPVPADLLVYTEAELHQLIGSGSRFGRVLENETVWVFDRAQTASARGIN